MAIRLFLIIKGNFNEEAIACLDTFSLQNQLTKKIEIYLAASQFKHNFSFETILDN